MSFTEKCPKSTTKLHELEITSEPKPGDPFILVRCTMCQEESMLATLEFVDGIKSSLPPEGEQALLIGGDRYPRLETLMRAVVKTAQEAAIPAK